MSENPQMWTERSMEGLIDVWAFKGDQVNMLQHLQPRIRYLYLGGIERIQGGSFDRLEILSIEGPMDGNFFNWNAPTLCQLSLAMYDGGHAVSDSIRSSIRTLRINNPSPSSNWHHLFTSFEHLEGLSLHDCPARPDEDLERMSRSLQALNSLINLRFRRVQSKLVMLFLSKLSCLTLKSISFGDFHDQDSPEPGAVENKIIEFLHRTTSLQNVVFQMEYYYSVDWPLLLQLFIRRLDKDPTFVPSLQTLHLAGYYPEDKTSTLNIRQLVQALYMRYYTTTTDLPMKKGNLKLLIGNDPIWEADHEWYQTMDGRVERMGYKSTPHLWKPMV